MEWQVKINDAEYRASSIEELKQWYRAGRARPDSYVYHPVLERWMYARDLEELKGVAATGDFNPGVAAVLSLVIPGAGQMYRGSVGAGLAWLLVVVIGYFLLFVPGLVLHLVCIFDAAKRR